mgnify:CR=1 FL=1
MKKQILTTVFAFAVLFADAQIKVYPGGKTFMGGTSTTPLSMLSVNGGVAIGTYAGTNAAPTNGLIVSGNVGIGTASHNDNQSLEIFKTANPSIRIGDGQNVQSFGTAMTEMGSIQFYHHYNTLKSAKIYTIKDYTGGRSWGGTDLRFAVSNVLNNSITDRMTIDYLGRVGIGTMSPSYLLHVNGTAYCSSGAWESDSIKKKDIQNLSLNSLDIINKLRPITFEWKLSLDSGMTGIQMGFLAQDIETVLPSTIVTMKDTIKSMITNKDSVIITTKGIKYNELFPLFVKAMQQQQKIIDTLTAHQKIADSLLAVVAKCCSGNRIQNNNNDNGQGKTETILQVELANNNQILLYQNEPNPFDGSTIIRYFIPENITGSMYVVFYDLYGKEVNKIEIKEKGFGKIEANTENLATGIYSYSMVVNDKVIDTKKMLKNK